MRHQPCCRKKNWRLRVRCFSCDKAHCHGQHRKRSTSWEDLSSQMIFFVGLLVRLCQMILGLWDFLDENGIFQWPHRCTKVGLSLSPGSRRVASLPRAAAPGPPLTLTEENVEARRVFRQGVLGIAWKGLFKDQRQGCNQQKYMVISLKSGTSKVRIGI